MAYDQSSIMKSINKTIKIRFEEKKCTKNIWSKCSAFGINHKPMTSSMAC